MKYTINNQNQYVFLISRKNIYIYMSKKFGCLSECLLLPLLLLLLLLLLFWGVFLLLFYTSLWDINRWITSRQLSFWGTEHFHSLETTQFALLVVRDSWTLSLVSFYKVSVKHLEYFSDCKETLKQLFSETT